MHPAAQPSFSSAVRTVGNVTTDHTWYLAPDCLPFGITSRQIQATSVSFGGVYFRSFDPLRPICVVARGARKATPVCTRALSDRQFWASRIQVPCSDLTV